MKCGAKPAISNSYGSLSLSVNMGGFVSTIAAILLIGVVLQVVSPPGSVDYTLDHYRIAFSSLLIVWLVGVVGVIKERRLTRADLAEQGIHVKPVREALRRYRPG